VTVATSDGGAPAAAPTAGSPSGTRARTSWPRCRAMARTTGCRCKARGDGLNGLCKNHTGLILLGRWREPMPTWELQALPSGIWLAPSRPARTWRKPAWPQRVSWSIAVRLITSGQVTHAILHRNEGAALLREIERCGVRVVVERADSLVRRLRFEVDDRAASKRLAKRTGKGADR
jgi:hypothetical protein